MRPVVVAGLTAAAPILSRLPHRLVDSRMVGCIDQCHVFVVLKGRDLIAAIGELSPIAVPIVLVAFDGLERVLACGQSIHVVVGYRSLYCCAHR